MDLDNIKQNLGDAGCNRDDTIIILKMLELGNIEGALQMMKKDRCRLMDELHESGRKVDRIDYLIRQTEKEIAVKS